jgi:hypothetical protein
MFGQLCVADEPDGVERLDDDGVVVDAPEDEVTTALPAFEGVLPVDAVAAEIPRPRLNPAAVVARPATAKGCRIFTMCAPSLDRSGPLRSIPAPRPGSTLGAGARIP